MFYFRTMEINDSELLELISTHGHFPNNGSFVRVPLSNRIMGVIYVIFSIICVIPYVTCLWCILMEANLRNKPTYIIVLHVGVADLIQLLLNGVVGGVFAFWGTTWNFWLNKAIGGFMNIGWVVYTALAHVLALNRYVCICWPQYKTTFFSTRKTNQIMLACWMYGLGWLIAYLCPDLNLIFNVYYRCWDYDVVPLSRVLWLIELLQDTFHFFMSVVWYAFSFAAIKKTAGQISVQQINENKKERKLLIQAMLICAMLGLTLIGFFLVPQIDENAWATTASTLIWLACCGNNCAIYLIFNKTLRHRVFEALRLRKPNSDGGKHKNRATTIAAPTRGGLGTRMPFGSKVGPSTSGTAPKKDYEVK